MKERVLVVDPDATGVRVLSACLDAAGYDVVPARTAAAALVTLALTPTDALLVDGALADLAPADFCMRIRQWTDVPVIVLGPPEGDDAAISLLDAGADDLVEKPFVPGVLLARLRAVTRRRRRSAPAEHEPLVSFGEVEIDLAHRQVRRAGKRVHLTPREYGVLATLSCHVKRVVPHRRILEEVWGKAYAKDTHYLHVYMASLRRKLEREPSSPRHLLTETGVGYRLEP